MTDAVGKFGLEQDSRFLQFASISFDVAVEEIYPVWAIGGAVVLLSDNLSYSYSELTAAIERHEVTTIELPTAYWREWMRELLRAGRRAPRCLDLVVTGDEKIPVDVFREWKEHEVSLLHVYGVTEVTVNSMVYLAPVDFGEEGSQSAIPIGKPIANTEVYLLDDRLRPTPLRAPGEIYLGGVGLARGYLNQPEMTAEKFTPSPFGKQAGSRLYKSGDLARFSHEEWIEFIGRADAQVKVRGYRIELGEIESQLARHPAIKEVVALAREDNPGDKRLVAYYTVVATDGARARVDEKTLRAYLSTALPGYMAPEAYVELESLPLTPNGKLDRRALPQPDGAGAASEYEAPVGDIEARLARIWAEALRLDRVSRHDNFFALGGHSLLAIRLIERIRREGLQANVRSLFLTPTLAAFALSLADGNGLIDVPPNRIQPGCEAITPEMLPLAQLTQPEIDSIVDRAPGGAPNIQDIYPLGPLQEGMLFHHILGTEGHIYLTRYLLAFSTRAMLDRVLRALQAVIDRHDILRTAFFWEGLSEPVQVVRREALLAVEEINLDPTAGDVAEELYARFDPRHYRLDVRQAPLMRVYIAEDAPRNRWVALLIFHHLSVDHVAFDVLLEEVHAHLLGRAEPLPEPLPFRNFVAQARLGVSREEHESFFRKMLGDVDQPTAPYGLIDAQGDGSSVREAGREVDPRLAIRLRQTSRALEVSVASLYHLAWAVVLGRVSGRDDVVFGTVLFGRVQGVEGADRAFGMLLNTLPVRIRIDEKGVGESVRQTHRSLTELMRHEHAPLALAQRCSGVEAPAPLFGSLLNYRHSLRETGAWGESGRSWEGIEILAAEERTNYPLTLSIDDLGDGFILTAQTAAPADPLRVCELMLTALERLVEALERAPETSARAINALPEAERRQVVDEWNATEADYPKEKLIHELFEERAEKNPHAVALIYEEQSLTYGDLNARANRLAHHLIALGLGPEARVAICMGRSLEMVVAMLATLKAGAAYVPLDPNYPPERWAYMLEDSEPLVLLTHGAVKGHLAGSLHRAEILDFVADEAQWSRYTASNPDRMRIGLGVSNLAYIIYTSGSTGTPKGVMVGHANIVRLLESTESWFGFGPADVWALFHSYAFDFSVWELWGALAYGGSLVIVPQPVARSPEEFHGLLCRAGVTVLNQTPSAFRHLITTQSVSAYRHSLRIVIFGGEALDSVMLKPWFDRHGDRRTQLVNMYGITETTVHVTYRLLASSDARRNGASPIGRRIPDLKTYILDASCRPAPVGVSGELYVAGAGVARGYFNRPELTAERFLPDPFGPETGGRIYKTSDLGRWQPEGEIEFLGRNDCQVKMRGFRIELGEIEARLTSHPDVNEAVVLAREEGDGEKRLVAYYTGEKLEAETLRSYLARALPDYMAPAAYVHLERLPLTPNGKLDRRALPAPDVMRAEERDGYLPPQTQVEEIVIGIFEDVLKLDRVGRGENFFDLGGHSLLAIQVISRVRNAFGFEIKVRSIFDAPTAEGLSRKIKELTGVGEKVPAPPLVKIERKGERSGKLPLSFAQQRLWFIDRMNPGSAVYNIPGAVRLEGGLDIDALEKSINEIVRRHEALRTRFEGESGEPAQVIDAWTPRRLEVVDLRSLPPEERQAEVSRRAREESETGFGLSQGSLLRVKLLKLEEKEHALLFTMHHIVSDEWLMGILIKEVGAFYQAFLEGDESPLPELEIQYVDFAVWQREYLAGSVLENEVGYWRNQLKGAAVLELPADRPRPAQTSYRGGLERIELGREVSEGLRALSRREGVTLFMALMASFKALLMKYSGQEDVSVGTVIANRMRKEVEGLIGFFANTLVMRTDLSGNPSFSELLKREREVALEAYAHQELPFEKLVEDLNPERDLSRNPLFQVMMVLERDGLEALALPGVKLSRISDVVETADAAQFAKFDLTLLITDLGQELSGSVEYSRDLFEERTIERLIHHYKNVLEGAVKDSERPIWSLDWLGEREWKQIVEEWNETRAEYPQKQCVHTLYEAQAGRTPETVAVVFGSEHVSYGELEKRANRLANHLRTVGVGIESRVGVCVDRSVEMVEAVLGALKAGGVCVPLDPGYPVERLRYMVRDAGVEWVVTVGEECEGLLEGSEAEFLRLDLDRECIEAEAATPPEVAVDPDNLLYVIYTSGSTGRPRASRSLMRRWST